MIAHLTRDRALIRELRIGAVSACAASATTALITVTVAVLGVFSLLPGHQRPTRLLHMPLTVTSRGRLRSGMTPPRMGAIRRGRTAALALVAAVGALYPLLRRPIRTWGATSEEAASRLPGDELLEDADGVSTRAITIDAPAASVWPWLAQMGPSPRGGAYTYDWIENLLGLDMHSVDRVLPEFQHPEVGDTLGLGSNRMRLERVEPGRVLAWRSEDGNWVWTFVLEEHDGTTRLISRNRFRLPTLAARIGMLPMEPGSLVMERRMLRGIKERAERLASGTPHGSSREADSVPTRLP
jgi:hypothetical protein